MTGNHVQDDLTPYALGELTGEELAAVRAHLESCPECRRELERLVLTLGVLGMAKAEPASPSRLVRQRLLESIEPNRPQPVRSRSWWVPALATALLLIAVIFLGIQNYTLQRQLQRAEARAAKPETVADAARRLLLSPDAVRLTLRPAKAKPEPEGRAIFVPRTAELVFIAGNLQTPPARKAYQLWLLPVSGQPIPAGIFKPDARGEAAVVNPPLPRGIEAKGFAVTLEPEAGSAQPTSEILMVATL